ncbi:unnamed protein product [Dicrocoelium dendriticum]|nr:unnamed protein product [Dicrocoelium dendriticum]
MNTNSGPYLDKNVPPFFIPATYKGHQSGLSVANKTAATGFVIATNHLNTSSKGDSAQVGSLNPTVAKTTTSVTGWNQLPGPLFASPSGMLNLSHYNYTPVQKAQLSKSAEKSNGELANRGDTEVGSNVADMSLNTDVTAAEKEKKRKRFRRPRKNSKLDRLIRFLEDKRIGDDDNEEELEDLQMPRLRKVLNIIFVTFGVCFLLAVITVILYTTIAN